MAKVSKEEVISLVTALGGKGGGGEGGTTNYNELDNLPQINGTTLEGNKTAAQLGLASSSELDDLGLSVVSGKLCVTYDES